MSIQKQGDFNGLVFEASPDNGSCAFVLDVLSVREIVQPQKLIRTPGATPTHPGLMLLRDETMPVIDLALLCGLSSPGPDALLMVVDVAAGQRAALRIHQFFDIEPLEQSQAQDCDIAAQSPWLKGLLKSKDARVCLLLDPSKLKGARPVDLADSPLPVDDPLVALAQEWEAADQLATATPR